MKALKNLFSSDTRVIVTEGDYVNPTVVFNGFMYEVPSTLDNRVVDCNGVKVSNGTLIVHLIRG